MFGVTTIHPIAIGLTLFMGLLILLLPHRYVIAPFFIVACFITEMQRIVIADFDFTMLRLLLLPGFARIIIKREGYQFKLNRIDILVIAYIFSLTIIYIIREWSSTAIVNRLGYAFNVLGMYFFFRILIRDLNDILFVIKIIIFISLILATLNIIEYFTQRNLFAIFGGVPEITYLREGKLRCQGPFPHPLIAGVFGATLLPLFIGLWLVDKHKWLLSFTGALAATIITLTSASSGPILTLIVAIISLLMWPLHNKMKFIKIFSLFILIGLQIVSNSPIWALVMRVGIIGGSHGYHRYKVMDNAIRRFGEWWLIGMSDTSQWGYGMFDITNHYVHLGIQGGLITLILFILIISMSFKCIGRVLLIFRDRKEIQLFLWALGSALFSHVVAMAGMNYFGGQILASFYLLISMISNVNSISENSIKNCDYMKR